jgi:hypothetical protein
MIENNLFIITAINSVLIIVVLFILFRLETNKIKLYLKRIDKKISNNKNVEYDYDNDDLLNFAHPTKNINNTKQNEEPNKNNENKININDIDSYIDPMNN